MLKALPLLLSLVCGAAVAVPQPIRDTSYDWRCVNPDGTVSNHQRQDTAIYACQVRAEANPGQTYYIEGGRYRVTVTSTPTLPPGAANIEYTSTAPSGDSIHPALPAGTRVRVWILSGSSVIVKPNGSTSAVGRPYSIAWAYLSGATWLPQESIEWR